MIYTDDDGSPVGRWVAIDRDEYWAIVSREGGLDSLGVFAACTEPERRVYTEWGRLGDDTPLVSSERRGPMCSTGRGDACTCDYVYRRFERFPDPLAYAASYPRMSDEEE